MYKLGYRREIDGLRALAVIPILFFHAGISGFSGGFVGVDIFFVISGFLITSIIKRELEEGSFTFLTFWARRARRILPAALVMILVILLVGWFVLLPGDYEELGKSARYQAWFGANIFFAKNSGYFSGAAELKPLLHTWSLAVEEQFYLIFPMIYLVVAKLLKHYRFYLLLFIAFVSLGVSQYLLNKAPENSFYLLHSRAWELLIGSLLAHIPVKNQANRVITNGAGVLGIAGIVFSICIFDDLTPFPGLWALLPTLSTAIIILSCANGETIIGRLLSSKLLVGIGLISYSLYLWHWPIMALTRHATDTELSVPLQIFTIIISFVVAFFSWRYIETPFRSRLILPKPKYLLACSLGGLIVVAGCGQIIRKNQGFPTRLPEQAQRYALAVNYSNEQRACAHLSMEKISAGELCEAGNKTNAPSILHFGDSHAEALYPAFKAAFAESDKHVLHASNSGCIPLPGAERYKGKDCPDFNAAMLNIIKSRQIKHVVLSSVWSKYIYGGLDGDKRSILISDASETKNSNTAKGVFEKQIIAFHKQLKSLGVQLWIIQSVPEQKMNIPHKLTQRVMKGLPLDDVGISFSEYSDRNKFVNALFTALSGEGVKLINPAALICTSDFCPGSKNNISLYKDDDHLSIDASIMIAPMLRELVLAP